MLDLASPLWAELDHCYGRGDELPPLLAELSRVPPGDAWRFQDWEAEPLARICTRIVHQLTVYPATFAVVPHLVELLRAWPPESRVSCLFTIGLVARSVPLFDREPPQDLLEDYRAALSTATELVIDCLRLEWASSEDLMLLHSTLAALRGHSQLADTILGG